MGGINYKSRLYENSYVQGIQCVFISHQKNDSNAAKKIADYLLKAGINVYFDEYDNTLDLTNPYSVVSAIKKGLNHSTHLLVILSENALRSKWIPWEVGYAYDSKKIISLKLKDIASKELPEYLRITKIISGTTTLNEFISNMLGGTESYLLKEARIVGSSQVHPLDEVLQWNL